MFGSRENFQAINASKFTASGRESVRDSILLKSATSLDDDVMPSTPCAHDRTFWNFHTSARVYLVISKRASYLR